MGNKVNYTEKDVAIVAILKGAEDGMTIAEISEAYGEKVQPGTIAGMVKKGLIAAIGERNVVRLSKRPHTLYNFVTAEVLTNAEGKPCNYTDSEKEILKVAATFSEPFTLADLAAAMGRNRLTSGNTNGLVKKGNFTKCAEPRMVDVPAPDTVNVYGFVADVPADAVIGTSK